MIPQNLSYPVWPSGAQAPGGSASVQAAPAATNEAEARALMSKGFALLQEHRYDEALEAFQEGFRLYPSADFILNEGATLLAAGRYAEAVLAYDRYLDDPHAALADEARVARAEARSKLGGTEATITGVAESQRLAAQGTQALNEGRFQDALDAFERAARLNPVAGFTFKQAECLEKLGRPYAAADRYAAYLEARPGAADAAAVAQKIDALRRTADAAPIAAVGRAGGDEWMGRGNALLREHRYDEAVAAFREGFRTYPDERFIFSEATALLRGGRYTDADLAFGRYLDNPGAPRADEARAGQQAARAAVGGHAANITDIDKARRAFDRGAALEKAGRYAEALEQYEQAYRFAAAPETLYNRALCLEKLGRREEASKLYAQYAKEMPGAPDAAQTAKHAETLHKEALQLAGGAFTRGETALREGRYRDAAMAFAEANAHVPSSAARYNGALALDRAGETARAVREYQLYLNETPNAPDAAQVRQRIQELQAQTGNELLKP